MPITGRAGTEPRSTDRNYTAGPVRCIGGLARIREMLPLRCDQTEDGVVNLVRD